MPVEQVIALKVLLAAFGGALFALLGVLWASIFQDVRDEGFVSVGGFGFVAAVCLTVAVGAVIYLFWRLI